MSLLKRVKRAAGIEAVEKDQLGGRKIFDTNVYPLEIKDAFIFVNANGSTGVRLDGKMEDGQDYSTTLWIGDKKGNNFYTKDGKQYLLPAYIMFNTILQLVLEVSLDDEDAEIETTEKVVKLGDKNQTVEVVDGLVGSQILIAIEKQRKNKTQKDEATGKYVPTNEITFENEMTKVFCADKEAYGYTLNELIAGAEAPEFMEKWLAKNKDQEINKFKPVAESAAAPAARATGLAAKRTAPTPTPRKTLATTQPAADEPVEEEELEDEPEQEEAPAPTPARRTFARKQ